MSSTVKKIGGIVLGVGLMFVGALLWNPYLIKAGATISLLAVAAVLTPKPDTVQRLQEQSVTVRSAVKAQELLLGRVKKSGVLAWFGTSGDQNEYLWFVVTIAEHEVDGYETLHLDDVAIDIATEIDVNGYVTKSDFVDADGNYLVKTKFYTGLDTQTADSELVAAFTEWTIDHKGEGVAYLWARLELDRSAGGTDPENPEANVWHKGYPRNISATLRGSKIYDSRLDSTNGGTGTHRADDDTTWEWSENAPLNRVHYLRSSRFGPAYLSTEFNWTVLAAEADKADTLDSIPNSETQKRYTLNGVVTVDEQPKAILEALQTADHGITLFRADSVDVRVGGWDASSHTIDEDWIAGPYSAESAVPTDDAYNAVRGQYLSAAEDYTLVECQPKTSSAYETEDGVGRVWQDVVLPFTTEEYTAQRLEIIELKKSRQQNKVKIQCNFRAELVQVYEVVTLDLPGFSSDTFRVLGKSQSTDGTTSLDLREEVSTDWDYTVPDLAEPPVIPSVSRNPDGAPAPTSLAATPGAGGVHLDWSMPNLAEIAHIEIYAAATNDRSGATLVGRVQAESFFHVLAAGTTRYYWVVSRGLSNMLSEWEPVSSTAGVSGTAGSGSATVYYIKPLDGTAIKNGSGTLTIEAREIANGADTLLSSGTIKLYDPSNNEVTVANGYATGSDGYTGVLDSGDINDAIIITMKDGVGGTPLDTVSLVDIADGGEGVYGYIEVSNTLAWTRAPNSGVWTPATLTTDLDVTFVQAGAAVARIARRITLTSATGVLNISSTTHKDGDLNTSRVIVTTNGGGTTAITPQFDYSFDGDLSSVAETVSSSQGGDDGVGIDGMTFSIVPETRVIPTDSDGNNGDYANSGATIRVYEGSTELVYDGVGTAASRWDIGTIDDSGITVGTITDSGNYVTVGNASAMTADTAYIDFPISGKRANGDSFSITLRQSFAKAKGGSTTGGTPDVSLQSVSSNSGSGGTTTQGFRVHSDGTVDATIPTEGVYSNRYTWMNAGANTDYEVKMSKDGGIDTGFTGTLDTWEVCSTTRTWSRTASAGSWQGTVTVRKISTGETWSASVDLDNVTV